MPTFEITAPDGKVYQVDGPEGATQEQALAQVQAQYAQPAQQPSAPQAQPVAKQGFFEQYNSRPGNPLLNVAQDFITEPVAQMVTGTAGAIAGGWRGLLGGGGDAVAPTAEAMTYQPRTPAGRAGSAVVSYPLQKLAQGADYVGGKTTEGLTSLGAPPEVAGGAGAAVNTALQFVAPPAIIKGAKVAKNGISRPAAPAKAVENVPPKAPADEGWASTVEKVPKAAVPTVEELSAQASAAYKRADEAGVVVKGESLNGLKTRLVTMTKKAGLNSSLHPDSAAALKEILKSKGNLSLSEVETLRKIANDAKGSVKPADQRIASKIVDELDDFVDNLDESKVVAGDATQAAALKEARSLYSRQKKAEEINALIERAKISAPNFSASGYENALRTEFRSLAKNQRKMKRFTPEEQAAIKKVAVGGKLENTLRFMGRFAPTGPVSASLAAGAATLAAGPGGALIMVPAGLSRYAATKMTTRNALAAEETMRRGPNALAKKKQNELATAQGSD